MADAHAEEHGSHHSASHYVKIWMVLLVLLVISIAGPELAPAFGAGAKWVVLITAFGIAFVKAWLVVKHFMHLTIEKPIVWYILITCLVFMVLLFAGVSPDVMNHEGRNWKNLAAYAEIERATAEAEAAEAAEASGEHGTETPKEEPKEAEPSAIVEPGTPQITFADLTSEEAKLEWLKDVGEKVYLEGGEKQNGAACVVCHRVSGAGHADIYPTLVKQDPWLKDCATLKNIVKNGQNEEITIGETVFTRPMPPNPNLTDLEVAAVATYVRTSFGNEYGACMP